MESLKVGCRVKLKSGGPMMTIKTIGKDIECVWFDSNNVIEGTFVAQTLEWNNWGIIGDDLGGEDTYEAGATVTLKSGGPIMTVKTDGKEIECVWFDNANVKEGIFVAKTLDTINIKKHSKQ